MCGRFAQSQPLIHCAHALAPFWNPEQDGCPTTWNLAPGKMSRAFLTSGTQITAAVLKWGLLPSWADKDDAKPINARLETAATKPYFRKAWKSGAVSSPRIGGTSGPQPPCGLCTWRMNCNNRHRVARLTHR
ncbi:MAG: SOS response-associated peptidase [Burkholderiales bacterium]|nr:SOS response-associated peptidase [Burkholderiales bacterium]